jgi:hypothetical protein
VTQAGKESGLTCPGEVLLGLDNYICGARRLIAFAVAKSSFDKNWVGRRLRQAEKMTVCRSLFKPMEIRLETYLTTDKFLCAPYIHPSSAST